MPILSLDVVWQARFPDSACNVQISEVLQIRNAHAPLLTCLPDKHWGKRRHTVSSFWASFRSFIYFFLIYSWRGNSAEITQSWPCTSTSCPLKLHIKVKPFLFCPAGSQTQCTHRLWSFLASFLLKKNNKKRREGGREYYQCLYLYSFRTLGSIESK